MRIDVFLRESPMFAVSRASRRFESLAVRALAADKLNFLEGLIVAALFFEAPGAVKPSQLAETFGTTRGNISHCISSLEAKELLAFFEGRVAKWWTPDAVLFIDSVPIGATGKVLKNQLRDQYGDHYVAA